MNGSDAGAHPLHATRLVSASATRGGREESTRAFVSTVDSTAARQTTPCGSGSMTWRLWGAGRSLVLLHGASGSWTHWIRNILPLSAHFRLLVPDMPGFGDSDMPPEPHTAETLAGVTASGLDVVAQRGDHLDLAGFSFGGIIGGLVAAILGRRVRTLALVGPGGLGLRAAPTPALLRSDPAAGPGDLERVHEENLRRLMMANPARVDDLATFIQMENVRRARFKSGNIPESDILLRALPRIRARITGIWGARDAFVGGDVEERRRVLASVEPDLDFRVIDGAGHWVIYEEARRVSAALVEMLSGTAARDSHLDIDRPGQDAPPGHAARPHP